MGFKTKHPVLHGLKKRIVTEFRYLRNLNRKKESFSFNGENYRYFVSRYNETYRNERTIEIPLAKRLLDEYAGKEILKVGNVLRHYFDFGHDIIDKYEKGENVLNVDITDYETAKKYDLILSISTVEHIGFDEVQRYNKDKSQQVARDNLAKALENIRSMLKAGGRFVFTAPLGFNPFLDEKIRAKELGFAEAWFFKKVSERNDWKQVDYEEVKDVRFGSPFPAVNGLIVGSYEKA